MGCSKKLLIVIDGIIGAGKSTFIEKELIPELEKYNIKCKTIEEPVEKWKESGRLQDFYEDPEKRAFQFQTRVFHDRITEINKIFDNNPDCDVFIVERCVHSDILFMKTLLQLDKIDNSQYEDYISLWKMWEKICKLKPSLFFYINTNLTESISRIKQRDRNGEKVDKLYQSTLKKNYDNFFKKIKETKKSEFFNFHTKIPYLESDGIDNSEQLNEIIKFVNSHTQK